MNILSVGGGAREHAIVKALLKSDNIVLYSAMKNRNPGIAKASKEFLLVNEIETDKIADWAERNKIDLAVIGPEAPLGEGIVDALEKKGIRTVGPTKRASQIEISKQYMRALMKKHDLPGRVDYEVFDNIARLKDFMNEYQKEVVVKPVGLTGGKGVKIMGEHLNDKKDVIEYSKQIIENKIGGAAKVILEEKLLGEEFTFQVFCDGKNIVPMPVVQDHKRAYEGDVGPNTGGMGSYSCADHLLPFLEKKEYEGSLRIIQKTIDAMRSEGNPYKGILYAQFMLTPQGPKIIEFNCRFGDPEAMNVLPLLKSDFVEICFNIADESLSQNKIEFDGKATVCKYIVPKGYGVKSLVGEEIVVNEERIKKSGAELFYASVNEKDGRIYTTSSRSLGIVGIADDLEGAERISEEALKHVKGNVSMRHDIGKKESIEKKVKHMNELRMKFRS